MDSVIEKFYINGRFLSQPMSGVCRYAYELCLALHSAGAPFELLLSHDMVVNSAYDVSSLPLRRWGHGRSHVWEQLVLPFFFLFRRQRLIVSFTGLGPIFAPRRIMTIHDLSFWEHPEWFSRSYYCFYRLLTPLASRLSLHVLTVSHFSRSEILRLLRLPSDKVSVIYNAPSAHFSPSPSDTTRDDYFLTVSSIDPRKNFGLLFQAFSDPRLSDSRLYVVGGHNSVFARTHYDIPPNVTLLGHANDADLLHYYRHARGFIFPSLYEGFGLPPLEAMSCGCPVLLSDIPVFRELFGEAARCYFPPSDVDSLVSCLCAQEARSASADAAESLAVSRTVSRYSWSLSASRLLTVIGQVINPVRHNS